MAEIAVFVCQGCQQGENDKQLQSGVQDTPERDRTQEGVGRHPWPEKGILGGSVQLLRPELACEASGRGLAAAESSRDQAGV